jgi:hypothetical protein
MALPSTSHGLERNHILELLEQCSEEEVCNYDSGSEVDISEYFL